VTIDGSGFVSGATVGAGAGITVSNVAFVSSTRLTASFAIDGAAASGAREVSVTNSNGNGGSLPNAFTVSVPAPATLTLVFSGRLRDKVGGGDTALAGDGAADGTMTLTLGAAGGKTVTALQLSNGIGGVWDTTAPNAAWVLGVATSPDGALLNNPTTTAINQAVPDGGSLTLFASDYNAGQGFATGRTLTVTATFSDGTSAQATTTVTTVAVTVTAVTPNQAMRGSTVPVTIDGTGFVTGASVSAGAGITVTNIALVSSTRLTASFVIDGAATGGARDVTVSTPSSGGGSLLNGFTVNVPVTAAITLAYNGKLRDAVGGGDMWLGGDSSLDATMTLTLSAPGGKTVTALQLSNGIGGVWDTTAPNGSWLLGVALSPGGVLLNDPATMAVTAMVPDGGSLTLFASDYGFGVGFGSGRTLTVTATFSDGTSATASTVTP